MSYKSRVARLEKQAVMNSGITKVAHFIVAPGVKITQYEYQGQVFTRNNGESEAEFRQRCCDSINWPEDRSQRVIFRIPGDD